MHRQTLEREERLATGALEGLPTLETGMVVVAPGEGNRRLFKSLRATRVIEGGQTMNPSTEEIVAAVDATPATEVIVLPNNSNVILSAEQAVELVNKPMRVVPTRSVQAGLAAMVAYDAERSAGPRTRARWCVRSKASRRARSRSPRATSCSTGSRCGRVPGSVSQTARLSRAARASRRWPGRSPSGCSMVAARS